MIKKQVGTFVAGIGIAASIAFGVSAVDGPSTQPGTELGSPVACVDATCGTPVALPTVDPVTPTVTPEVTVAVEPTPTAIFVDSLPVTGSGPER